MRTYVRPIVHCDVARPPDALSLGWGWFTHVELLSRAHAPHIVAASTLDDDLLAPVLSGAGPQETEPQIMGILNATPDSFSDGGLHAAATDAITAGLAMAAAGAHVLDVGGESTRPGAHTVEIEAEIARIEPVIAGLRAAGFGGVISVDTRKARVAQAALAAGASLINDVSGFTYDPALAGVAATAGVPVCVMHGPVDPATMHLDPKYDDVVLDVYDFLEQQVAMLEAAGVARSQITVDPGIGFGKTLEHNLALLARISLFHNLGVRVLLGASRKRFIGTIGGTVAPQDRMAGSVAAALAGIAQGVQIVRVHDVAETAQAIAVWRAGVTGRVS